MASPIQEFDEIEEFDDTEPAPQTRPLLEDRSLLSGFLNQPEPAAPTFDEGIRERPGMDPQVAGVFGGDREVIPEDKLSAASLLRRGIGDPAVSAAKGIIGIPEAAVGLLDIPTMGYAGKILEAGGYGFQPKVAKEFLEEYYSPEQKAENEVVRNAKGFSGTLAASLANPSTIANTVIESIPAMLAGGAVGKTIAAAAPKVGALTGAAIGEGAVGAGMAAEGTRQQSETGTLTPKQAALSLSSGAVTGLLSVIGGRVARKLGIDDIDSLMAGATQASRKPLAQKVVQGMVSEGLFEELPQSAQEQIQANLANGRPWAEGVPEAAATGLLAGAVTGGGVNLRPVSRAPRAAPTAQSDTASPEVSANQPALTAATEEFNRRQNQAEAPTVSPKTAQLVENILDPTKKVTTNEAVEVGVNLSSVSDLDAILEARETFAAELESAKAEARTNPQAMARYASLAVKGQIFREAVESATNTGSHKVEARLLSEKDLPEPKLDWKKNPEVAAWIKANGAKFGIDPSEVESAPVNPPNTVEEPTVTLYRGADDQTAGGQFWTTDPAYAAKFGGNVQTVTVPKSQADAAREAFTKTGSGTPGAHILPPEIAKQATPMENPPAAQVFDLDEGIDSGALGDVGMGGARPSEFGSPVPYVTSNKNAKVDEERKARGLPPMMATARQSNQGAWDAAMKIVDETPDAQDRLILDLVSNPRALTPTENALVLHRRIELRNEYEKALHRWRDMFEFGDYERAAEESQRVKDFSSQLADLEDITKATGAESGRSLQARKMMANEDYTLAAMELAAMEAKGRHLNAQEQLELIRANEKIAELERRLAEYESGKEAREVESQTNDTFKEVAREAKSEAKSKDFDIDREERLLGGIKAKIDKGQRNEITPLVQQLARVFWRRGIRGREPMIDALHETLRTILPEFTRDDTQRAFSGYGDFKPLSKEEIDVGLRDLRGQTQQVLKLEALEARKPLEKTGQERRVPSDEERRLIKQVNELKRKYGVVVTDPATQLKSALQSRKTYYEHRISDLKHEIETRERIVKTKSPAPTDPELDALRAEHDRLKQEHDAIFPPREMTDEQRLKIAIAAAERNQAQWEARLQDADKGIFSKRTPGRKVTSAELELIQAETAAIREHVKELKDLATPKKSKEEIALQSLKTRMKTRAAELRDRIARGDFTKKKREPVKLDAEGNRLKSELDSVKEEFDTKLEQDRWAKMSVFDKTKRKIADTYDAARALMTTGEFSFILRQGKMVALSRPIQTAKALPDMFRALLASEQKAHEIDLAVHNHPDAPAARAAKLAIIEEGVSLHKQEELKMGRWVGKIPIIKNFNRAAQVFLNRIRMDTWLAMRKSLSKSGTPTPEEDRQIAMFVNEATGRGGLGKLEPAAVPLARVMFSPRYYASRLQLAAGHSLWGGTMRTRRIIATEYARSLIGLGLYYTMLGAMFSDGDDEKKGEIGLDPRSTDFGKVKIGNTRLDPLAGLSQVIVLGSRSATGQKVTGSGKVQDIRGKDVKFGGDKWSDIMARHLRGKLHPVPSSIANLFDGTDLGGDEATIKNQAQNVVAPITYMDIYAALKEQDLPDGVALALLALLGEGVQTYEKKEKQ